MNGSNYVEPFVGFVAETHEISYNKPPSQNYLTLKFLSDGYFAFASDFGTSALTIQYSKNYGEWENLTASNCTVYTAEITVSGKSGTYTFGGIDNQYGFYWENGNDKLYGYGYVIFIPNEVHDINNNFYTVLTAKNEPSQITTEITVSGKSGTYTFGGIDNQYGFYWENGNDKLFNQYCDLSINGNNYAFDRTTGDEFTVLTTKNEPNNNFIYVDNGDVLKFRGDNATYYYDTEETPYDGYFISDTIFDVEGNIMSLINSTGFTTATTLTSASTFFSLFRSCTGLTSAENLVLPATTLADNCYEAMFMDCFSLTTAPELPATTLADCCYEEMFKGCSNLNYIKCLATDISASDCTYTWVHHVAASGTFVKNPNMSSWTTGTSGIPTGWTVQDA